MALTVTQRTRELAARFGTNRADVFGWRSVGVYYSSGLAKLWINRGRGLASILYDASRCDRRLAGQIAVDFAPCIDTVLETRLRIIRDENFNR